MKLATFFLFAILIIRTSSEAEILDSISNFGKAISEKISDVHHNSIVFVIKEAKIQLAKMEKKSKSLIILAEQKLNELERKVNATNEKQQDDLAAWSHEQVQKGKYASVETKMQIELLIYNLLQSYDNDSRSCSDITLKPMKKLHNQTQKTVEGSVPFIKSLIDKIDSCTRLNQKKKSSISKCASEVKNKFKPIYASHGKCSNLFNQVKNVNVKKYRSSCSVANAKKVESRKKDVAKQIDELVKKDKAKKSKNPKSVGGPIIVAPSDEGKGITEAEEATEATVKRRTYYEELEYLRQQIRQHKKEQKQEQDQQ